MTTAEKLTAKLTGSVMLPVAKIAVKVQVPRCRELARAGLLPLRLTTVNPAELESDEMQEVLDASERSMKRLICECSLDPRIVDHKPKTSNQIEYDLLADEDRVAVYQAIMELASNAYFDAEPATESKSQLDALTLIAIHAKKWNLDPTDVSDWEPARFDELMMFGDLLDNAIKKAGE